MTAEILAAAIRDARLGGVVALACDAQGITWEGCFAPDESAAGPSVVEDSLFQIASMSKAVTSVAALQLVERGQVGLDDPVARWLPDLADPQVLEGFDAAGQPCLRPAKTAITLRHLLTHTSGLGYDFMREDLLRVRATQPDHRPGTRSGMVGPLLFDPGAAWEYGVSTDWAGLLVEAVTGQKLGDYLADHVTGPLGMVDTNFWPADEGRIATLYTRDAIGRIEPMQGWIGGGKDAEVQMGGAGLFSTARDYGRFLRMILNNGTLDGARILSAETMTLLLTNQIGGLRAGQMASAMAAWALPFDPMPGQHCGWSLGFLINPEAGPNGRSANSLSWAGIANCHYWIDIARGRAGVFLTQLLPFGDPAALAAFGAFERQVSS